MRLAVTILAGNSAPQHLLDPTDLDEKVTYVFIPNFLPEDEMFDRFREIWPTQAGGADGEVVPPTWVSCPERPDWAERIAREYGCVADPMGL